eukprot:m.113060 g.113060  ORF g.113060 m.113060 type:complete len:534 (-) comp15346_c1_seq1:249-1850(-)
MKTTCRASSLSIAIGAAILTLLALPAADGRPCPPNSFFMHSQHHNEDHCVCARRTVCIGEKCTRGHDDNLPLTYGSKMHGFPFLCKDCFCVPEGSGKTELRGDQQPPFRWVKTTDGDEMRDFVDPVFDESCKVVRDAAVPKPRALHAMNWLHFPKCGSSLTNTIYHYGCRDVESAKVFSALDDPDLESYKNTTCSYCYDPCKGCFTLWAPHDGIIRAKQKHSILKMPFREKHCGADKLGYIPGHNPLPPSKRKERSGSILAVFRDPRRRLVSAFNYHKHSFGMNWMDRERMLHVTHTIEAFANFPGIASCQTKMLIGFTCSAHVTLNKRDLMTAKQIIEKDLAFAGVMEHWNASICLFHRMFGGKMHPTETANLRPTQERTANGPSYNAARKQIVEGVRQDIQRAAAAMEGHEQPDDDADADLVTTTDAPNTEHHKAWDESRDFSDVRQRHDSSRHLLFADGAQTGDSDTSVESQDDELMYQTQGKLDQLPKTEWTQVHREHDPYDWDLYEFVRQRFYQQLKTYGFQLPSDAD